MAILRTAILALTAGLYLAACGGQEASKPPQIKPETAPVQAPVVQSAPKPVAVDPIANGKKFYKKCIACHRANGDGIPGSFPPLNAGLDSLAQSDAGRAYMALVVYNGLRGNLVTDSGSYNGIMVRQAGGKSENDVADLLNYVMSTFYTDADVKPFSGEEIKAATDANGRMSGDKVLALRPSK